MSFFVSRTSSPTNNVVPQFKNLAPSRNSIFKTPNYEEIIDRIVSKYRNTLDPNAPGIIETFYFIKSKISLLDPNHPDQLNKIIEDYLILIKKFTISAMVNITHRN